MLVKDDKDGGEEENRSDDPRIFACFKDWGAEWAPTACLVNALRVRRGSWRKAAAEYLGGACMLAHAFLA